MHRFKSFFSSRNVERFSSYFCGLVFAIIVAVCEYTDKITVSADLVKMFYPIVITFSSIMAAFMSSLFGVILATKESPAIKDFRKSKQFNLVKEYMFTAIVSNLLLSFICFIGSLLPYASTTVAHDWIIITTSFLFVVSLIYVLNLVRILKNFI